MRLNLLYQFNEKYAPYAGTSIFSIFANHQKMTEICVYILGEDLSESSITLFNQMAKEYHRQIIFLNTEEIITKMKSLDMPTYRGSYAANMRLFVSEILPDFVEKVLYLDADTIVDSSLAELWQMDMQGKAVGMVLDSLGEHHKFQIGLSESDGYYNSGVILFDLKQWKEKKYSEKITNHVLTVRNNYPAPDQDLLNIICKNDIIRLDARYNFQPPHGVFTTNQYFKVMKPKVYYSKGELEKAAKKINIYHCFRFIGEFPWHEKNLHPYGTIFDSYLYHSPWKNYQKEKAAVGTMIRIERILYKILPKMVFLYIFKWAHRMFLYQSNQDALKNKINKMM